PRTRERESPCDTTIPELSTVLHLSTTTDQVYITIRHKTKTPKCPIVYRRVLRPRGRGSTGARAERWSSLSNPLIASLNSCSCAYFPSKQYTAPRVSPTTTTPFAIAGAAQIP